MQASSAVKCQWALALWRLPSSRGSCRVLGVMPFELLNQTAGLPGPERPRRTTLEWGIVLDQDGLRAGKSLTADRSQIRQPLHRHVGLSDDAAEVLRSWLTPIDNCHGCVRGPDLIFLRCRISNLTRLRHEPPTSGR